MTALEKKTSPMMEQWEECKKLAQDSIVLFRLGDFYEAFHEDAVLCSKELDLTLTKRQTVPMSGIPSHTLDGYIDKLVAKGFKVAIVEQVENAKETKGLVKREIVRIVTAGTVNNSNLITEKSYHYIAALSEVGSQIGIAFFDVTCSDCRVIEVDTIEKALSELYRFQPKEIIASHKMQAKYVSFFNEAKTVIHCMVDFIENWRFDHELAYGFLTRLLHTQSLDGFGLKGMVAAINAAGALLAHVKETLRTPIGAIQSILPYSLESFMTIDRMTMKNLDLIATSNSKSKKHTLLYILDHTQTPMGGRMLKRWLTEPLLQIDQILARQDAVDALLQHKNILNKLKSDLGYVRDLERLIIRIGAASPSPRDLIALKNSLKPLNNIKETLQIFETPLLQEQTEKIQDFQTLIEMIEKALVEDAPFRLSDGGVFNSGYDEELDSLLMLSSKSKEWMSQYQDTLRHSSGIKTLKVGYTRVSGFYIEISKGQAAKTPETFHRRQTLTNAERFITPELKAYEESILTAEEKIAKIEWALFQDLREKVSFYTEKVLGTSLAIAKVDCLISFASLALENHYVRPSIGMGQKLEIVDGRHPVIEASIQNEKFIPNDTLLDADTNRLMLITGPNMAGKSTYIRQVALITIMAQIGSFVPARRAHIDLIDKVFTRIGASDDLSRGQSTFMVEMIETANILHHATSRSLVILDEIGRGTSTYDGISLAWSIAEFLLTTPGKMAKTLFATHYWELTKLEEKVPGAVNFNVAVHESGDNILFLRKIVKGGTDKSYGIHVARLAGLPQEVLVRAQQILLHLEENSNQKNIFEAPKPIKPPQIKNRGFQEVQLSFINMLNEVKK